jgi:acetyltransferase-like isoleucine patch superfamily enzyme
MYKMIESFLKSKLKVWTEPYTEAYVKNYLDRKVAEGYFDKRIKEVSLMQYLVFGDSARLQLSSTCVINNALFNLSSGNITVGDYVFFGHNVSLITGTHNYRKFGLERMHDYPKEGNNIIIEEGAWIASNATIIGPCKVGRHSVIAAGAVVKGDVPSYHIVAGVPAKTVKKIIQ